MAIDKEAIKEHIRGILVALGDDPNREGLKETPDRVPKMYEEVFEGMNYSNHEIALQSARSSVLLHELGHFANFLAGDKVGTSQWKSIYNAEKNKYDGYNKAYAIKSASEYFAESYKDYKEHPSALRSKRPRTYQFVKSTIDGITDSDVQNIKDTYGEYWGL